MKRSSAIAPAFFMDELPIAASELAWRLIHRLEADPFMDGRTKFVMTLGEPPENAYIDENFWIFYHLVDDAFVVIDAMAPSSFAPDWTPPSP